jgi:major membrane immunogen (membrane-anchored lipoprotein)
MKPSLKLVPLVAALALLLGGCQESPSETAKDVAQARTEANKDVREGERDVDRTVVAADAKVNEAQKDYAEKEGEARKDLGEVESDAAAKVAAADYELALTEAEGRAKIETEKCAAFTDAARTACLSTADANLAADRATALARRDATLAKLQPVS